MDWNAFETNHPFDRQSALKKKVFCPVLRVQIDPNRAPSKAKEGRQRKKEDNFHKS